MDIYKGQEEDKQDIQKVINHKDINKYKWYKTTWEPEENLKNAMKKIKKYYKRVGQAKKGRID